MDKALSDKDIVRKLDGKVKILLYSDLKNYDNIDEVLNPYGKVAILYYWKAKPYYGHWVGLLRTKRNTIEVFNSFGDFIDRNLDEIPENFRKENDEAERHLSHLLRKSDYDI